MNTQVLIAAMNQNDHSLLEKMNIQSDAIIGNQTNYNKIEKFIYNGHSITYLNFDERGVGLNRNNSLMRANGDICLFADDDMVYVDDYVEKVKKSFEKFPKADIIVFNLKEKKPSRYIIKRPMRIGRLNYLRFGAARIAVKNSSIKYNTIYFNQCFGGGTEHCHGEDNIFLCECLKKGLKIYAVPLYIAELTEERESTWNKGYDNKYFRDQGYLYKKISRKFWRLLCLQDAMRHQKLYDLHWISIYKKMTR